jgi:hypothetical protein
MRRLLDSHQRFIPEKRSFAFEYRVRPSIFSGRAPLVRELKSETGSAIIEFLVVAIPLFVPLVWFITSATGIGVTTYDAAQYARNLLRVYVTTPSADSLQSRLDTVTNEYREYFYPRDQLTQFPSYVVSCEQNPCLIPGGKVTITVNFYQRNKMGSSSTSSTGYVDRWSGL